MDRAHPIFGTMKSSAFSTNPQSRFASVLLDSELGPTRLARHSWQSPWFSVVLKQQLCWGWGPLKGAVSVWKRLQSSEAEAKGVTGRNKREPFSPQRVVIDSPGKSMMCFRKRKQKKMNKWPHLVVYHFDQVLVEPGFLDLNAGHVRPGGHQAKSLTQFYSVDFSQPMIGVKKCIFNKHINQSFHQLFLMVSWELQT